MLLLNFKAVLIQPSGADISSIVSLYVSGEKKVTLTISTVQTVSCMILSTSGRIE